MSQPVERPAPLIPWREILSLDVRSLALLRIGLGVLLVFDWIDRLPDLRAHYGDEGVWSRQTPYGVVPFSIHMFHGSEWFQWALAVLAFVFAGLLVVGYRTPVVMFFNWLLLLSVHGRNVVLLQGGDMLLRLLLFWGMFLPLGACWSLDSKRSPPRARATASVATFAYLLQLCLVYLFASALKWAPEWRSDGTAVYQALGVSYFATRVGLWLRDQTEVCRLLTYGTLWLETLGPALLWLPFSVSRQRMLVIAAFLWFHVGLAVTMELGNFPWVCCVMWLALLPTAFWDRVRRRTSETGGTPVPPAGRGETGRAPDLSVGPASRRSVADLAGGGGPLLPPLGDEAEPAWAPPRGPVTHSILVSCIVYIVLWNVRFFDYENNRAIFPDQAAQIGWVLGLDQNWGLFAPRPGRSAGWYVMAGTLADGTKVDLYNGKEGVEFSRPELVSATYANGRWRKMIINLGATNASGAPLYPGLLPGYARYLAREWTRGHGTANPLRVVEIIYMRELVTPPGEPMEPAQPIPLYRYEPRDDS